MKTLIKNGQINTRKNMTTPAEIWIEDGRIKAIGTGFSEAEFDEVFDAKGQLITPGLVDVHVHLREPGFTYKETIEAGTRSAARGGFTTVCAMPNLNPVPDTAEKLRQVYDIIRKDAVVKVLQYAPITENLRSEKLVDQEALIEEGAFAFTNDGVGVQTAGTMYLAMKEAAKNNKALVAHTEDESLLFGGVMHAGKKAEELGLPGILSVTESSQIARDLLLAEATGVHYHVCHVSTKESVRVIRDAKKAGIHVTAEVSPHHLILIDEDIPEDFGFWKMNPPLRGREDREALIEGLLDGTIDCIATDHAPHGLEEKSQSFMKSPFGIVGSETAFQLIYTHFVETGRFTLEQVINWLAVKPAEIFGLNAGTLTVGAPADVAVFDITQTCTIDKEDFLSKGENTPFIGLESKRRNTNDFCQRKTCVAEGRIKVWNVCLY
ncbi:dihydroorotase [Enterococcus faecium]|nr:dihydroorotase [Enterococcus faecium]